MPVNDAELRERKGRNSAAGHRNRPGGDFGRRRILVSRPRFESAATRSPPFTPEARVYVHNLALSGVAMQAHTSYLNQQVVEITGNLQNTGDRKLALVEINCIFYDPYGKVLLRQRVPIISRKMGGLSPGETKAFRLPFDTIPEDWNQATPQSIAQIQFQ